MSNFRFLDLFSGIGGFHLALSRLGGECVLACEMDKLAQETYFANFSVNDFCDDVSKLIARPIPKHDILCAGFPCQPFSISGKQNAFNDARSKAIDDLLKIIHQSKPKVVLLENVKHLIHVSNGKALSKIICSLVSSGYKVSYKTLNAKNFGVAQNRERLIIIANKKKYFDFDKVKQKCTPVLKEVLDKKGVFEYLEEPYTILKNKKKQTSGLIFAGYRNKTIRTKGTKKNTYHLSRVHKQPNRIYSIEGVHPTIPSQESSGRFWVLLDNNRVRKLTINECFRLMGFPERFKKPVPLSALYRQIGNSVCVPKVHALGKSIIEQFNL